MSDGRESVTDDLLSGGLDLLGDPVLVFDEQGSVIGANERARELSGDIGNGTVRFENGEQATISAVATDGAAAKSTVMVTLGTPDDEVRPGEKTPSDDERRSDLEGQSDDENQSFEFRLSPLPDEEPGSVIGVGRELDRDGECGGSQEDGTLATRERALRRAYDVIADADRSLDAKIHDMLRVVRETIGTDFATLSRVEGEEYIIEAVDGPPGVPLEGPGGQLIEEGDSIPLSFTNCERVVETTETLVLEDVENDAPDLATRPVNAEMGISCYLGAPVFVEGETYGTFCFYDMDARSERFSEWEVTFVELLGNWVSYELERERLMDQIRREERERYETLVEQSTDGVVVVQDGEYAFVNDRFLDLTGQDRETLLGTPFEAVFTPEYRDLVTERYEQRIAGAEPPNQYDVEIETAMGTTRTLELAVSRIERDGRPATMATFRDVTERKRREQSVRALEQASQKMQSTQSRERIGEIATDAARDALGLPLSICWFYDGDAEQLSPVVATDPVHDHGYFEPITPDQYEFEVFRDGGVTDYTPSETGYEGLETGVLLPLGEHGLLAAGQPDPTDHDNVILDVARTLAEHTRIALDRIERTQELERTRARFLALTENTSYGVVTIGTKSTVRYASAGIEDVFGYTPAELEGKSLLEIMPERFHDVHENAVARYLRDGTKQLDWSWIELPGVHRDGHEVPLGISFGEATVDGEQRFSAVIRDITEQRERERELREERAFTESVFAALPDVFYAFDEHGQFLRWNDRFKEVTGYSDEEIEAMQPTEFIAPEDREQVVSAIAEVFEHDTAVTVEATFETSEGDRIPYEFTGAKLVDEAGERLGLVGIGRDISDRKERQRRFEAVFDNTYQFTGLMEPDGTLIEANETALEFGDLDREDVVGERVWDAFWFSHSEDLRSQVRAAVELAADGEFVREEVAVQGSDREAIIDFSVRPVTDDDGDVTLLIPEGRDITELKEREEELRRERDHVRRTEELADVGGWEIDLDTETMRWTTGTRQLHEVSDSFEPTLERAMEFVHTDDRDEAIGAIEDCREAGDPFNIEVRIVTAKGRTRWVRVEGERVTENGVEKLRGVMGDVTERKEREQRLMVLNRVLRHNLRNKLSVVSGYAEALEATLDVMESGGEISIERAKTHTRKIKASATDLVDLGEKARQFERAIEGTDITGTVEVRPVLTELAASHREQHSEAEITVEAADLAVRGNAEFLKLAVGELIDNAITHSERPDPTVSIAVSAVSSEQVEITVADNGPGILEMERKTLTEGEETSLLHGSGVGLWTVNWLVTRIGGHVSIDDNEPQGTVVTLTVPAGEHQE